MFFWVSAGVLVALFVQKYFHELYENEKKTVEQYRRLEVENSSLPMRLRKLWVDFLYRYASRYFPYHNKKLNEINEKDEAILRIMQYRHFVKNKNRTTDFANIGVAEKFPFP